MRVSWRTFWVYACAAAIAVTVALPVFAVPHLHGPLPSHLDFNGHTSGEGSTMPLFIFAGIAVVDGIALAAVYLSDRSRNRYAAPFWFFVAVAMWWLFSAQAGFVAAGLHIDRIPWGAINVLFIAAFVLAIVLLLRSARSSP